MEFELYAANLPEERSTDYPLLKSPGSIALECSKNIPKKWHLELQKMFVENGVTAKLADRLTVDLTIYASPEKASKFLSVVEKLDYQLYLWRLENSDNEEAAKNDKRIKAIEKAFVSTCTNYLSPDGPVEYIDALATVQTVQERNEAYEYMYEKTLPDQPSKKKRLAAERRLDRLTSSLPDPPEEKSNKPVKQKTKKLPELTC